MLKYILFLIAAVLLICNYLSKKILGLILKKEPEQKQEVTYKLVLYAVTLLLVICIMVNS